MFGGVTGMRLWRAMAGDAAKGQLLCCVAVEDEKIVAACIAASRHFHWAFLLRHPVLSAEILWHRLKEKFGSKEPVQTDRTGPLPEEIFKYVSREKPPMTWNHCPGADRALFTGTLHEYRGRHIAAGLKQAMARESERPLVGRISAYNVISVRSNHAGGWKMWLDGDSNVVAIKYPDRGAQTSAETNTQVAAAQPNVK